jgi:hypothetical protein
MAEHHEGSRPDWGSALFTQHQEYLESRGVSPDVARERGYRSADTKAQLRQHGFSAAQALPGAGARHPVVERPR